MKKRVLSILLAALMLIPACLPLVPVAAAEPAFEAADYDALYVQNGLVYAVDFFSTNSYWGGESISTTDKAAGAAALNSFITKGQEFPFEFNGSSASTVIRDGYFLNNKAVYQLLVSTSLDKAINYTYDGATMEMVGVMDTTSAVAKKEPIPHGLTFSNIRFGVCTVEGKLVVDAFALQTMGTAGYLATDLAIPLRTGSQATYTLTVDRPTDTQTFYTYSYSVTGAVQPSEAQKASFKASGTEFKASGNNFFVTHTATYDGETVTAVSEIAAPTKDNQVFAYSVYRPVYAEFEGEKYIVGAIDRVTDDSGIEPYWHDVTTDPGHLALYEDGEALYRNDAVRFPNNAGYGASTYWRLWGQGNDMSTYAMRYYKRIITTDEMALNHAADLMKWFRLDITRYSRLDTAGRLAVAELLAGYDFTADPAALQTLIDETADAMTYDLLLDGLTEGTRDYEAAATFLTTAKEYLLDISDILLFPQEYRTAIYEAVNDFRGTKSFEKLMAVIDEMVKSTIASHYGEYDYPAEYNYRDLYVRQDQLTTALDFFDATPEDGNVYVGVSYDDWNAQYDYYSKNWATLGPEHGGPFETRNDALVYVRENRTENGQTNNWADVVAEKYLWRGSTASIQALDISDRNYPHTNIRTWGDGRLICTLNNSFTVKFDEDASDVTYQVVAKASGGVSWQLRGFRVSWRGTADALKVETMNYNAYGVSGTEGKPSPSSVALLAINPDPRPAVDVTYSTDMTAVADKRMGVDTGHYYKYEWDAATGKYAVTEVATAAESNSGLISYYGRMDLAVYANGQYMTGYNDLPYMSGGSDSIGNGGANEFFAIRIYSCTLTPEEIAQNHFADLAGYYDLDLRRYRLLSEDDRAALHQTLLTLELGTPDELATEQYAEVLNRLYYDFESTTEAADFFRTFAAENDLTVTELLTLSPLSQERVFEHFANDGKYVAQRWFAPILQKDLEDTIAAVRNEHYGESLVHTLVKFRGFQLKKGGDFGMRAVFTLESQTIETILAHYEGAVSMTVGAMLLPESMLATPDAMRVQLVDGEIKLPDGCLATAAAYADGAFDPSVFTLNGERAFACEFFPEDVNEEVVYIGYAVLEFEDTDPVIFHVNADASFGGEDGLSLFELTRYAKLKCGMAYENVQKIMNEASGDEIEDIVLSVGTSNITDFVILSEPTNLEAIEALQALIEEYVGVRLTVVSGAAAEGYEHILRIGTTCDIFYEDADLYGLAVRDGTIDLWYLDHANTEATLAIFAEILAYARTECDGSYLIPTGTSIIRRAR